MIFLRIRRGKHLTFGANGEKPNVKWRTHQTLNYRIKSPNVSWGSYCMDSGVWQDCQSLPTRTLHQGAHSPSRGQEEGVWTPSSFFPHAENWESCLTFTILLCVNFVFGDFAVCSSHSRFWV